jgi:nucleoside-diphosphate-sugar epimerase
MRVLVVGASGVIGTHLVPRPQPLRRAREKRVGRIASRADIATQDEGGNR